MATINQVLQHLADQLEEHLQPDGANSDPKIHIDPFLFASAELPSIDMMMVSPSMLIGQIGGFGDLVASGLPLNIRVRVSPADIDAGQGLLYDLIDDEGPLSILQALHADHTLNGVAQDIHWGEWPGPIPFPTPNGDGEIFGSRLPLVVIKTKS